MIFNNKNSKLILTINCREDDKTITIYNSSLVENSVKKYFENESQFNNFIKSSILSKLDLPINMSKIKVNLRKDINKFKIIKI